MDEYISKQAILKHLNDCKEDPLFDPDMARICFALGIFIENMKAADVQPVTHWISVKERLPETGKSVLIYYPKWDGDEIQVAKLEGDGMMFDICGEFNIGTGVVTHWMPLPEPPKDGDAE